MNIVRKWHIEFNKDDTTDWPDTRRRYSETTIRPDRVVVDFVYVDGKLKGGGCDAWGYQVKKDGTLGVSYYSSAWFALDVKPEWIAALVAEAKARVEAEIQAIEHGLIL